MTDFKYLLGDEWYEALKDMIDSDYFRNLGSTIARERSLRQIYPEKGSDLLFKAFRTTPISEIKVVILGQDPYHDGSYDGFAFSNSPDKRGRISPSLQNILTEVQSDCYPEKDLKTYFAEDHSIISLERWAKQGVLLINTAHTVAKGVPGSHTALWKYFTEKIIKQILVLQRPIVFILWGNHAKKIYNDSVSKMTPTEKLWYDNQLKLNISSAHPSPFSAYQGFFGSKPFTRANNFLANNNLKTIVW
jgi:uracil-DNA glycosylase